MAVQCLHCRASEAWPRPLAHAGSTFGPHSLRRHVKRWLQDFCMSSDQGMDWVEAPLLGLLPASQCLHPFRTACPHVVRCLAHS